MQDMTMQDIKMLDKCRTWNCYIF